MHVVNYISFIEMISEIIGNFFLNLFFVISHKDLRWPTTWRLRTSSNLERNQISGVSLFPYLTPRCREFKLLWENKKKIFVIFRKIRNSIYENSSFRLSKMSLNESRIINKNFLIMIQLMNLFAILRILQNRNRSTSARNSYIPFLRNEFSKIFHDL